MESATVPSNAPEPSALPPETPAAPVVPDKFKNADGSINNEALLASYSELENKLSSQPAPESTSETSEGEPTGDNTETQDQPQFVVETKTDDQRSWETETYGGAMASVFDKVGLDAKAVADVYESTGVFPEEAYAALEGQGIPRTMVDNYLGGGIAAAEGQKALIEKDIAEIKTSVGGDGAWNEMMTWAATLPEKDVDTFNRLVNSGDKAVAQAAVDSLHSRFVRSEGREGNMSLGGRAPTLDTFKSAQEATAAMQKARQTGDPAEIRKVEAKMLRSNVYG